MKTALLFLAAAASLGIADHPSFAKDRVPPEPAVDQGARALPSESSPRFVSLNPDTFVLAAYDFAGLDPQGWTTHDITAQVDTFFHVDNFAGVPGYAPLSGAKSLWCGTNESIAGCPYLVCTPGYGDYWDQRFESVAFPASGDVTLSFAVRYDSEPGYDRTYVQYRNGSMNWTTLVTYEGAAGPIAANFVIPAASLPGSVKIRLRFVSDNTWSDADCNYDSNGALVIDDISISDSGGLLDSQDFESEPVGALATADGDWSATVIPGYGTLAALYPGAAVLQEDPNRQVLGALWGFFADPAVVNYDYCGQGHPEQGVIPYGNAEDQYFHNAIRSPVIAWNEDENGAPVPGGAALALFEFDVYRDLTIDDMVFYAWSVRSFVNGCPGPWRVSENVYYGAQQDWYRQRVAFADLVDPAATHVQLSLRVFDGCGWPSFGGLCALAYVKCHTHAPLFANIRVVRVDEGATAVGGSPGRAHLDANVPNPFNPQTEIRYTLAEPSRVSLVVYDVAGRRVRTLVAEAQAPRAEEFRVVWDGTDDRNEPVASGIYFYRLVAGGFTQTHKMVLLK